MGRGRSGGPWKQSVNNIFHYGYLFVIISSWSGSQLWRKVFFRCSSRVEG